jgi:hypothetical protein
MHNGVKMIKSPAILGATSWAAISLIVMFVTAVPAEAQGRGKLTPHRAVYGMFLAGTSSAQAPSAIRGVMSYAFRDKCDGWQTDTKVLLRTTHGSGPEVKNVRILKTWEAKDGRGYRFGFTETHGGRERARIKGVAVLDENGGVAEYTKPVPRRITLPPGTLFPARHIAALIKRAEAGGGHFGKVVFDGTADNEPYHVSAVIGAPEKLEARRPYLKKILRGAKSWKARLAYFPVAAAANTPEFALNIFYREDGIIERMLQDYGDHVVEARLNQIEMLPKDACAVR